MTRLRAARAQEQDLLARWQADPASPFEDWSGPPPPGPVRVERRCSPGGGGELVVTDDADVPIGTVSWRPVAYGPTSGSQAFDIGISIPAGVPRPGARQPGAAAARRYLFCTTAVHRVQASTDAENAAERAAPVRAGFTEEGLLRGAQWRAGGFRDLVGYARLRTGA